MSRNRYTPISNKELIAQIERQRKELQRIKKSLRTGDSEPVLTEFEPSEKELHRASRAQKRQYGSRRSGHRDS